jgi:hypothetical protein
MQKVKKGEKGHNAKFEELSKQIQETKKQLNEASSKMTDAQAKRVAEISQMGAMIQRMPN